LKVFIDQKALEYVNKLPEKDRRLVKERILDLVDPRTARDVELFENGHCRMHVSHSYTVFFDVLPENCVKILEVLP
jgi:mRNA-degrading endonuclease RelE of RelBE toxin-antitoxin system